MDVSFFYKGIEHTGDLSPVCGGASPAYYFMQQGHYRGQLVFSETFGWQFSTQKGYFPEISEQLVKYLS